VTIQVVGRAVSGYPPEAMIMIECGFIFDVYGSCPNDYSSPAIDEEGTSALREMTIRDCSASDGGYSIEWRCGDPLKQSAATSRSFEGDSNVIDASDLQFEKEPLQSTSTVAGT
jgi:hypothetical protein